MKARVTQNDIARAAGVHNTTVSLALRHSPAIPEATRKRIQAIADELGYYPDPALQALVAYRNGRIPSRRQETLAYITNWNSRWGWQDEPANAKFYAGAQRKAAEGGYQLEHFWLGEPGMTQRRLNSMLFHRGITGLILAAHRPDQDSLLELDWPRLTAVKIGCYPHSPALHRVMDDQPGAMRQALKRIIGLGYERIGLVIPGWWDDQADEAWSAGYLAEQSRLPGSSRIPLLVFGEAPCQAIANGRTPIRTAPLSDLAEWLQSHQPEVVVSFGSAVRSQLDALGLRVPRDVAYVDLFLESNDHLVAGIRENCETVGEVAIEILIGQMQQNLRGIPEVATATLVEGTWLEGDSLPGNSGDAEKPRLNIAMNGLGEKLMIGSP